MLRVGIGHDPDLSKQLELARSAPLTYEAIGSTRTGELPSGFRHDCDEIALPAAVSFECASEALRTWRVHVGAGLRVYPEEHVAEGATFLLLIQLGPMLAVAPCRVVWAEDEPDRFAFAYGTLEGHPERGEEAFIVERSGGQVFFRIAAFSRPGSPVTRIGRPLARRLQRRTTIRYLEALRHIDMHPQGGAAEITTTKPSGT